MDLSFWNNLNSTIIVEPTTKQFFGRYNCRMVIDCPGGRLTTTKSSDIKKDLAARLSYERAFNRGGSWRPTYAQQLTMADVDQIENLRDIRLDYESTVKFRVEEPKIQVYATDQDMLRIIAARILPKYQNKILAIQIPLSDKHTDLLNEGKILLKPNSIITHKYKIVIRDGDYPIDLKKQVLSYLQSLGDEVRISEHTVSSLSKPYQYTWGSFFYVNDPGIATFLTLMHTSLISKIHEVTQLEE